MNIVFFGSSKYSVIVEKALYGKFGLSLVVTIPDKPVGRKQILTPSPVKKFAIENDIPVLTFEKLDKEAVEEIRKYPFIYSSSEAKRSREVQNIDSSRQARTITSSGSFDFLVVADYGLILPKKLLEIPKYAPLNIHHSLLPKYRGPSPAPTAILNGDKVSGVTVIKMVEKMDAGDILSQEEYALRPEETTDSLLTKLNTLGAELVIKVIEDYKNIKPISQDESRATYTKKMTKEDGFFDIDNPPPPAILDRKIRAYYPWPGAYTKSKIKDQISKTIKFLPEQKIQVEGKNPMNIKDFINGYPEVKDKIKKLLNC